MYQYRGYHFTERDNGGIVVDIRDALIYTDNNGKAEFAIDFLNEDLMRRNDAQQTALKAERKGVSVGSQYRILESMYGEGDTHFRIAKSSRRYLGQITRAAGLNQGTEGQGIRGEVSYQAGENTTGVKNERTTQPVDERYVEENDQKHPKGWFLRWHH